MKPENAAIFAPLRAHILASGITEAEVFESLGELALQAPRFAHAFGRHIADIIRESQTAGISDSGYIGLDGETLSYAWITAEAYRRALFDHDYAALYDSADFVDSPERLSDFVMFLEGRFHSDGKDPTKTAASVLNETSTVQ